MESRAGDIDIEVVAFRVNGCALVVIRTELNFAGSYRRNKRIDSFCAFKLILLRQVFGNIGVVRQREALCLYYKVGFLDGEFAVDNLDCVVR